MSIGTRLSTLMQAVASDSTDLGIPPEIGGDSRTQPVLSRALYRETRNYVRRVAEQVNGCYEHGYYDACAVMMRRLIETLLIELYESRKLQEDILDESRNYQSLAVIITASIAERSWNLSRTSKKVLSRVKDIGDKSAHDRRYNALRTDLEAIIPDFRACVQDIINLSNQTK